MNALLTSTAVLFLGSSFAFGDALFVEPFDYADGEFQAASSGTWTSYDGNPALNVASSALLFDFTSGQASPVNNGWYGSLFSTSKISSGDLFAHFDLTVTEAPAVDGPGQNIFAAFWNGGTGNRARLWMGVGRDINGDPLADNFRLGLTESGGSSSGVVWYETNFPEGSTVRVVIKYDFTTASLYVDAADESDVAVTSDDGGSFGLNGFAFRHKDDGDLGLFSVDNLALSQTYEDVTITAPEPVPAKVTARAVPGEKIFVTWKDESNSETGFLVERSTAGGSFAVVDTLAVNENYYIDTSVTVGTEYCYRVTALSSTNSEVSSASCATPVADQVVEVVSLASLSADEAGLALEIDAQHAVSYQIEESTDLVSWAPSDLPPVGGVDGALSVPLDTPAAMNYYRINGTLYPVPQNIGLTEPFSLPINNGTGSLIDASSFGLTSDDASDDDAIAIRSAISSASAGDVVFIPAGNYHVATSIDIPNGVTVEGAGSTATSLIAKTSLNNIFRIPSGRSDITLRAIGMTRLEGVLTYGVYIGTSSGSLVSRVHLDDLFIEEFAQRGIQIRQAKHVKVENCRILNATELGGGGFGYAITINDDRSNNNWVTGNVIGPVIRHGVLLQYETHNNLIEHNVCMDTTEDAYDLHGEDEYNNELRFNLAFWVDPSGWDGTPVGFGIGNTGSTHDDTGPFNWIHHNEVYGFYGGLEVILDSHHQFIDGNYFHDNERVGIQLDNGGGDGVHLRGNILRNNGRYGIDAFDSNGMTAENNQISGHDVGIEVVGSAGYNITGNDLSGNTTPTNFQSSTGVYQNNTE